MRPSWLKRVKFFVVSTAMLSTLVNVRAQAQGEIAGRVTSADSVKTPLPGVEASIARLKLSAMTDSSGRFRLKNIPAGSHTLVLRAIGFRAESSTVTIDYDEVVSWDKSLQRAPATALPERVVTAPENIVPAKLSEFMERKTAGIGHFIDGKVLERAEGGMRQTGDILSTVPGVIAVRRGGKIWVTSGRGNSPVCAFCKSQPLDRADSAMGAPKACYMDIYVDGTMVFDSKHAEHGLFNVNTIPPDHISGIEVYTSTAQIPVKYNRTGGGCGVVLIWTR